MNKEITEVPGVRQLVIAITGLNAIDSPGPGVPVIRALRDSKIFDVRIIGLSYELSGDQQKAAQIYWEIWHDFPDSHYALLARYKLEPVKP